MADLNIHCGGILSGGHRRRNYGQQLRLVRRMRDGPLRGSNPHLSLLTRDRKIEWSHCGNDLNFDGGRDRYDNRFRLRGGVPDRWFPRKSDRLGSRNLRRLDLHSSGRKQLACQHQRGHDTPQTPVGET